MSLIKERERREIQKKFAALSNPVKLLMFTQDFECEYCSVTRELLEELAGMSDRISVEVRDFVADAETAGKYGMDKIPATAVLGEKDYGIRFFGVPAGYEFASLLDSIVDVGRRDPKLAPELVSMLAAVDQPVHVQVMVTPTWPYCSRAVRTAHRFAMASEHIRGDMVEVSEFPHLAVKYGVQGVPHTIINEKISIVGAVPESEFARKVLEAIGK